MYRFCPTLRMRWETLTMKAQPIWQTYKATYSLTWCSFVFLCVTATVGLFPQSLPHWSVSMSYTSSGLHHANDHEQPGPGGCSGRQLVWMLLISMLKLCLYHTDLYFLTLSSPRSSSPMEGMDRCLVTGRRWALTKLTFMLRTFTGSDRWILTGWLCLQFRLVMHYLSEMTEEQTLVMYSGHPMGLFPSLPSSPRAIITNGMVTAQPWIGRTLCPLASLCAEILFFFVCYTQVIPNYSSRDQYEKMFALGVSM